ncbi:major facilitator family transporter (plasmid) [Sinorhizobium fredii NGR234]|uniref:Major facilitator family transporter n=1 Tax=Sinorhizobium fredii (strain NBRC 101917 / NGR234) TaxID=394 RepID=C3KMG9_SINFN|nr:major facilitator family transporter [Sinorhizobium fredii NGR234]
MAVEVPKDFRRVIIAASVGNIIEWYDFYIFGSLAAVLSVKFFEQSHPVAALLSTIALFTAGFLIRPLGAFLFGWMGDRVGRKYTFLMTLSGMGLGTGAIGLIPTYEAIGLTAAFILFGLRSRACAWAGNMAAPSPMWPNMSRMNAGATTPAGFRPLQRSGSSCRWP